MPFCQILIGPPGSGKSTYCYGMHQFMSAIGRQSACVNLDPANDQVPYPVAFDIRSLTKHEEIMKLNSLGPNGSILFALETLEKNLDWLTENLEPLKDQYLLFDCPGQAELFTHHTSLKNIIFHLERRLGYRPVVVNMVDSHHCTDPAKYISILLMSLQSMLQLEMPQVNVLTKIDKLHEYGNLDFKLDFYKQAQAPDYLLEILKKDPKMERFAKLNAAIAELISDFSLVYFQTLSVEDKESMTNLLRCIDKAGGYVFGSAEGGGDDLFLTAMRQEEGASCQMDDHERWMERHD